MLRVYVQQSLWRFREEDRVQRNMWEAVEVCGLPEEYHKKANGQLQRAYDEAHLNNLSELSSVEAVDATFCLRTFVRHWMHEWTRRAWETLKLALGNNNYDQRVLFLTAFFQYMTHPDRSCLPITLLARIPPPDLPTVDWPFIAEVATMVCADMQAGGADRGRGGWYSSGGSWNDGGSWGSSSWSDYGASGGYGAGKAAWKPSPHALLSQISKWNQSQVAPPENSVTDGAV
jgi:hypothetical protein